MEYPDIDRRVHQRFPLHLSVHCAPRGSHSASSQANGTSLNIGSGGILLRIPAGIGAFEPGQFLRVAMEWPARLDGKIPLRLVAEGKVLRVGGSEAALEIIRHEFRTCAAGHGE